MIIIKAVDGSGDQESREYVDEAFQLAALRAKETESDQGLFCPNQNKPFVSVSKELWGKI